MPCCAIQALHADYASILSCCVQALHADLWAWQPKLSCLRFPHILWKQPGEAALCTTQVLPGGFTWGAVEPGDYERLQQVSMPGSDPRLNRSLHVCGRFSRDFRGLVEGCRQRNALGR